MPTQAVSEVAAMANWCRRVGAADFPLPIRLGPSIAKAHLAVAFNWDRKPLYDVVATIPGATLPDQWVIRGNHHDAWVNGADDPLSGRKRRT